MCDIWKERKVREIGPDEVARWREEWKTLGVERVVLSGGEALLHSDLWRIGALLREAGMGVTLLSSGLLLKKEAARIAEFVDDLVVSLDGPPLMHDAIRNVPRAYEKLAEGVRAVRAASPGISISARCTVQRRNALLLREVVRTAAGAGFDRISFLAVDVSSSAFNRPEGEGATPKESLALSPKELPALAAELDALEGECAEEFASGFIAESPRKLRRRLLGYFTALAGEAPFPENSCNAPWVSAVVEADGTVRPCFFHAPLGNIREAGSLSAVLNSAEAAAFRRSLDVATDPVCARCVCTLALTEP
jgi:MoaA/NifB/PqqE/SkfB family radical SAM enzyme